MMPHSRLQINWTGILSRLTACGVALLLLCVAGLWLNELYPSLIVQQWQTPLRTQAALLLTEYLFYAAFSVVALGAAWFFYAHPNEQNKLAPGAFAVIGAAVLAFILKGAFDVSRPYELLGIAPLAPMPVAAGSSFPSGHAAVSFALVVALWYWNRWAGLGWLVGAIAIAVARVYQMVHTPLDVLVGAGVGLTTGALLTCKIVRGPVQYLWQHEREFRRQSLHMLFGFFAVFLHWADWLRWRHIAVGMGLVLLIAFLHERFTIPWLKRLLSLVERNDRTDEFPAQGMFWFLFGIGMSVLLFPQQIAYASILILSVGDSLNHFVGGLIPHHFRQTLSQKTYGISHFLWHSFPWNARKNPLGVGLGIAAGTIAAQFFVPLWAAALASTVAILVETIPVRLGSLFIDDNFLVPLTAGGVLVWVL